MERGNSVCHKIRLKFGDIVCRRAQNVPDPRKSETRSTRYSDPLGSQLGAFKVIKHVHAGEWYNL